VWAAPSDGGAVKNRRKGESRCAQQQATEGRQPAETVARRSGSGQSEQLQQQGGGSNCCICKKRRRQPAMETVAASGVGGAERRQDGGQRLWPLSEAGRKAA